MIDTSAGDGLICDGRMTGCSSMKERSVAMGGGADCVAKGKVFLSKTTWREMMLLCVVMSIQRIHDG